MLGELLVQFESLAGIAALIAALVNAGKALEIVKDGDAAKWSLGLNVGAFAVFAFAGLWGVDVSAFDGIAASVAAVLASLLTLLGQFVVSGAAHQALKKSGVVLFGKSHG
jgi:uncharacterized membrane protein